MTQLQIGIMIEGQNGLTWERWDRILSAAEESGYQCVFRSDHFTNPQGPDLESLELWTSLTYAAAHTERIEFGPLVTPVTFRHPAMTARYAAAVDDLSGGRLVLGVGAGWQDREHKKFGVPFYDFPTRFDMLAEYIEVTRRLLKSDEPVHYTGTHYQLEDALLLPRPQRHGGPPLLIGGSGPKRTLPLVAQYADEWNAVFTPPDVYEERTTRLDRLLSEAGRSPQEVKRSLMTRVLFMENVEEMQSRLRERNQTPEDLVARGLIVGTGPMIVEQLEQWAARGVSRFMLQWLELDKIDRLQLLAQKILPHFQR